jgi:hypothetical protein
MQANPDNGWIQIESIRLVGFEFEARRATSSAYLFQFD